MPKYCPQLKSQLEEIKSLHSDYCLEFEQAKNTKEYETILNIQKELETNIKELITTIENLTDPYESDLRYDLAQKLNLEYIGLFKDGLAIVRDSSGRYFIDKQGTPVFGKQRFDVAYSFSEGLARVSDSSGYYYIDHKGRRIGK